METAGIHGKKVFCHRRIHSIFATTEKRGKEATTMFQIELLSGGVFWVYAVYPQISAFLI